MAEELQRLSRNEFKILTITIMFAICGMLGIDIHLASLPYIMDFLHTDKAHMQQSISLFLFGMGVSLLFYGPVSDKYGRRPVVIFGLLLAAITSFAASFSKTIHIFLLLRLLQGVGSGVCIGVGRTILADVLQGVRLATTGSYFSMFISLSPLLAPALGGYVQHWLGWQANFIVLGGILTFVLLIYYFVCPETNTCLVADRLSVRRTLKTYLYLLSMPIFLCSTLITGIAMAANMAYATISPFVFQIQFHVSPVDYGWLTAFAGAGGFIGRFVNPTMVKKLGSHQTLFSGLLMLLIPGIWILAFNFFDAISVSLIIVAVFTTLFGQSCIVPNATSFALSEFYDKRGAAGAIYGSFQLLTAFLSSAVVGLFSKNGVEVLAVAYCFLGVSGLLIYSFLKRAVEHKI